MSLYGAQLPPVHQFYVAGPHTTLSETATEITESGVYQICVNGNGTIIRITDTTDTTTPTATNGIVVNGNNNRLYIYIKAGQFLHAKDDDTGCYTLMKAV